ncbi:PP2C family protein-serine/threonine phosphatase [Streptomyces longispororuber]|uniref:PP2C family protein-serine/threonine phosphatase n=1 Tax=Streptomyces longispororuber TaxID=68230 RepID=UPI0036FE08DC
MNAPHPPKVAGIDSTVPPPAHTAPPASPVPAAPGATAAREAPGALIQDRLAGWVSDLTTLHELTERLSRTTTLDDALHELLRAGAALAGARRGLVVVEPADGHGPDTTVGLGFARADLGHLETVPRAATSYGRLLDAGAATDGPGAARPRPTEAPRTGAPATGVSGTGAPGSGAPGAHGLTPPGDLAEVVEPDLFADDALDPRHREVAARLGYAASYALPLATATAGALGAAAWHYDEPAEPTARQRHLIGLYVGHAAEHVARLVELTRARATVATLREELLPTRLPRVPGVQLAARRRTGARGGGDWHDALPLPDAALGLAVGSVTGSGPGAVAATGRLRASLRAYAVMEGEDPVAVLSDLELLLRLTEPARSATALFAYCEPALRKVVLAGAGHSPPLLVGQRRTEFVETSLSAPLGMLACWEAPSVEIRPEPGETLLLYTDGLLRRTGDATDRAFARLHAAAASVPKAAREDPGAIADHILGTVLPDGLDAGDGAEDVVLLAARFA